MKFLCVTAVLAASVLSLPTGPGHRMKRQDTPAIPAIPDIPDIPETYLGAPYGALGIANGVPYGALAISNTISGPPHWDIQVESEPQQDTEQVQTYSGGPPYWDSEAVQTYQASPVQTYQVSPVQTYQVSPVQTYQVSPVQTYQASPVQPPTYKEGCQNGAGSIVPCAGGASNIVVHIGELQSGVTQGAGVEAVDDRKRRETKPILV